MAHPVSQDRAAHEPSQSSLSRPSGEHPSRDHELRKRAKYITARLGHIKEPGYVHYLPHNTITSNAILHNRDGKAAAALIADLLDALDQRA